MYAQRAASNPSRAMQLSSASPARTHRCLTMTVRAAHAKALRSLMARLASRFATILWCARLVCTWLTTNMMPRASHAPIKRSRLLPVMVRVHFALISSRVLRMDALVIATACFPCVAAWLRKEVPRRAWSKRAPLTGSVTTKTLYQKTMMITGSLMRCGTMNLMLTVC